MRLWIGGRLVDPQEPAVSAVDHGLLLGDGLFETILTLGDRPIALERHVERLARSGETLGIASPAAAVIRDAVAEVLNSDVVRSTSHGRLRITVSSGVGPLGLQRGSEPTLSVLWQEFVPSAEAARLNVAQDRVNADSIVVGHKHTSWLSYVLEHQAAHRAGATDALLLNLDGDVVETTTANIFLVKNRTVITPPLSAGCLPGVTRQLLIELMPTDIRFAQMTFSLDELLSADEVFLTSSLSLIKPVAQIADTNFTTDGAITAKLSVLLTQAMERNDV